MARDPNDRVTISYRIPERLRIRIEEAAASDGLNITQEMTKCIEYALNEEERIAINSPLIRMLSAALNQIEQETGGSIAVDKEVAFRFRDIAVGILRLMIPYEGVPKSNLDTIFEMMETEGEASEMMLAFMRASGVIWSEELVERLRSITVLRKRLQAPSGEEG